METQLQEILQELQSTHNWTSIEKITKGWSDDKKYKITTEQGEKLLLRLSTMDWYEYKKKEYEIITKYSRLGIPMSMPLEFGTCGQGEWVYMLLTWVEGQDLQTILGDLPEEKQYELGCKAGKILRKIHSIPLEEKDKPETTKIEKKKWQLSLYESSDVRIADDEIAVQYVKENIDKIWKEKPVYQHGDFHPGNLIYMENGELGVIDFNRWEVGDPYEEFYKLESFVREISVSYCIGQINAYFNDEVPMEFWDILAVYVAHASLYSIKWAEKFGQEDIDGMTARCKAAFEDYDYFKRKIPVWYQ